MFSIGSKVKIHDFFHKAYDNKTGTVISNPITKNEYDGFFLDCYHVRFDKACPICENQSITEEIFFPEELELIPTKIDSQESFWKILEGHDWEDNSYTVTFEYTNIEGIDIYYEGKVENLWKDWLRSCSFCPSDTTYCGNIKVFCKEIGFFIEYVGDLSHNIFFTFEDLMYTLGHGMGLEKVNVWGD